MSPFNSLSQCKSTNATKRRIIHQFIQSFSILLCSKFMAFPFYLQLSILLDLLLYTLLETVLMTHNVTQHNVACSFLRKYKPSSEAIHTAVSLTKPSESSKLSASCNTAAISGESLLQHPRLLVLSNGATDCWKGSSSKCQLHSLTQSHWHKPTAAV